MRTLYLPDTPTHVTYRLYGSIPNLPLRKLHADLKQKKCVVSERFPCDMRARDARLRKDYREQLARIELTHYLSYDRFLDRASRGPSFLDTRQAKQIVLDSWKELADQRGLRVYAISVMSNHVHILLENARPTIRQSLVNLLTDHKCYTAKQLNRLQQAPGRRVWAEKEYSRTVRRGNFERTLWYVLNNPVKAGLTDDAVGWSGNYWAEELWDGFISLKTAS